MANMNMPPVPIPPLESTLKKWAIRSAILLAVVAVWVLFLDGDSWLWWAWAAFSGGTLALALILRRVLGGAAPKKDA
ncbi:MAG: hypothetical protein KDK10_10335 [Maritimibacter sp.]|nr:hypothetical protein [Maritimibacter sp.]